MSGCLIQHESLPHCAEIRFMSALKLAESDPWGMLRTLACNALACTSSSAMSMRLTSAQELPVLSGSPYTVRHKFYAMVLTLLGMRASLAKHACRARTGSLPIGCARFESERCQERCAATSRISQDAIHHDDNAGSGPCGPSREARPQLSPRSPDDVNLCTHGTDGPHLRHPLADPDDGPCKLWHQEKTDARG